MLAIIDYKAGNLTSLTNAIERLGFAYKITSDPNEVKRADKIIFPGQGAAGSGMKNLKEFGIINVLKNTKVPFLGICLGMQLLFEASEENNTKCLGILSGKVRKFQTKDLPVPQMGWNSVKFAGTSPLIKNIPNDSYFYFANSYVAEVDENTIGVGFYGGPFTAIIQKDNFFGTQFHPEKSGEFGIKLLRNFLKL